MRWANHQDSRGEWPLEMRDALKRLGHVPIWVNRLDGLQNVDKLIMLSSISSRSDMMGTLRRYPKGVLIAVLWEPPTVYPDNYAADFFNSFSKIVTWDNSLLDNRCFFYFCYPVLQPMINETVSFETKKLAVMINMNKGSSHKDSLYAERREVIMFFKNNHAGDFDLYGHDWPNFKNYKGQTDDKIACLKGYRFCYAYENMRNVSGYVTEKIFDAFAAGCVPIYWGAKNITDYVPKNCFIDRRDFSNNEQLYQFLKNMSKEVYETYIANIKKFLASDAALLFSREYFVDTLLNIIEPGYDKNVALSNSYKMVLARLYNELDPQ